MGRKEEKEFGGREEAFIPHRARRWESSFPNRGVVCCFLLDSADTLDRAFRNWKCRQLQGWWQAIVDGRASLDCLNGKFGLHTQTELCPVQKIVGLLGNNTQTTQRHQRVVIS